MAIRIKNLTVQYQETLAIAGVSLDIEEGGFTGIIGPNGGGKTTLIKVILGLVQPVSGTVSIFGQSPRKARAKPGIWSAMFRSCLYWTAVFR